MKNSECVIRIINENGWMQVYRKDKDGWIQTTNGVVRRLTAEQLLCHILPVLVTGYRGRLKVVVEKVEMSA